MTVAVNPPSQSNILFGVPEGQDAFVLRERAIESQRNDGGVALHIAADDARAQTVMDLMAFFAPDIEIVHFPAWDCLPYDRVSPTTQIVGQRMKALMTLKSRAASDIRKPMLVLTTVQAMTRKIIHPDNLSHIGGFMVRAGERLGVEAFQNF